MKIRATVAAAIAAIGVAALSHAQQSTDPHGWLGTETINTRFGNFEFKNGYPTPASADALLDQLKFNRAIEVYLTQIPAVSIIAEHRGLADFGAKRPNQIVIWETLMDAETVLLTANTEKTVYALGHLDLKSEGPTVVEAPPKMLGFAMDALQRYLVDIGPLGPDKGQGGKYLFSPAWLRGAVPDGYFAIKSPTYTVSFGMRGFKVDGKTDQAVALMQQTKVYPLAQAANPPKMDFLNGSGKAINTVAPDTIAFFELLAQIVNDEPADVFAPLERFQMQAIGIERGKPFNPDARGQNVALGGRTGRRSNGAG